MSLRFADGQSFVWRVYEQKLPGAHFTGFTRVSMKTILEWWVLSNGTTCRRNDASTKNGFIRVELITPWARLQLYGSVNNSGIRLKIVHLNLSTWPARASSMSCSPKLINRGWLASDKAFEESKKKRSVAIAKWLSRSGKCDWPGYRSHR